MLRMSFHELTVDDKYSGSNMQNLRQQFQTPLCQKQKTFSWVFYCISEMYMKIRAFPIKKMSILA